MIIGEKINEGLSSCLNGTKTEKINKVVFLGDTTSEKLNFKKDIQNISRVVKFVLFNG